ncbi:MAG: hypothetical protein AVDCRST_MAG19-1531, partial [uncultured Thermomicrobiales bacterium]
GKFDGSPPARISGRAGGALPWGVDAVGGRDGDLERPPRGTRQARGRPLRPHLHDPAPELGCRWGIEPRAGAPHRLRLAPRRSRRAGARHERVHLLHAAFAGLRRRRPGDRPRSVGSRLRPRRLPGDGRLGAGDGAGPASALALRRRRGTGCLHRLRLRPGRPDSDDRRLPDRVEQVPPHPDERRGPPRHDCGGGGGGGADGGEPRTHRRTAPSCRRRLAAPAGGVGRRPLAQPGEDDCRAEALLPAHGRRQPPRLRARHPPVVGAGRALHARSGSRRSAALLRLLEHPLDRQRPLRQRAPTERGIDRARPRARFGGAARGVGEAGGRGDAVILGESALFRRPLVLRRPPPGAGAGAAGGGGAHGRYPAPRPRRGDRRRDPDYRARRARSGVVRPTAAERDRGAARPEIVGRRDCQRQLPARAGRLPHHVPGRDQHRPVAGRLRPRQGGHPERQDRRRDDRRRRLRRALRKHLLVRQLLRLRRPRPVPRLRSGPRQPEGGYRQGNLSPEPGVPRFLLPRELHRRRDGGRALSGRHLRGREPASLPGRGGYQPAAPHARHARPWRHPLRLRHALHTCPNAGRPRPFLLRDGFHVRVDDRDPPSRLRAGDRCPRRGPPV